MNRPLYVILLLVALFSCNKPKEEYFSITENNRKIDSASLEMEKLGFISEVDLSQLNNNLYSMGRIHFLINDQENSYYLMDDLSYQLFLCGNESDNDSIHITENINEKLEELKPIKTNQIIEILEKYQDKIVPKNNYPPLRISFALRNDTLKGPIIRNITEFMSERNMNSYFFRRMNDIELNKSQSLK